MLSFLFFIFKSKVLFCFDRVSWWHILESTMENGEKNIVTNKMNLLDVPVGVLLLSLVAACVCVDLKTFIVIGLCTLIIMACTCYISDELPTSQSISSFKSMVSNPDRTPETKETKESQETLKSNSRQTRNPRYVHYKEDDGANSNTQSKQTRNPRFSAESPPNMSGSVAESETYKEDAVPESFYHVEEVNKRLYALKQRPEHFSQTTAQRARYLDALYKELTETSNGDPALRMEEESECEPLRGRNPPGYGMF
jgi:hypothetical protein